MRCGVNPWVREIPWRRKWQPTPVFLLRKFHKQRSLAGCSPRGGKVSDTNLVIKQQLVQELATHSSTPAWKISCMEELQRLGHNWATSLSFYNSFWRRKWQRGLVGYSLWGCKELDTTKQLTHTHTHTHTHTVQYDLIFTLLHLQRPYFQIRSFHKYGELGLEHIFLVDIAQLTWWAWCDQSLEWGSSVRKERWQVMKRCSEGRISHSS